MDLHLEWAPALPPELVGDGARLAAWRSQTVPRVHVAVRHDGPNLYAALACDRCGARREWTTPAPDGVGRAGHAATVFARRALAAQAEWEQWHHDCAAASIPDAVELADRAWRTLRQCPPGTTIALCSARQGVAVPFDYLADRDADTAQASWRRATQLRAAAQRLHRPIVLVAQVLTNRDDADTEDTGDTGDAGQSVVVRTTAGTWWSPSAGTSPTWAATGEPLPTLDGMFAA